jgi:uncharacterized membrane protein YfcA
MDILIGFIASLIASTIATFIGGSASLIMLPILILLSSGTFAGLLAVTKVNAFIMCLTAVNKHRKRMQFDMKLLWVLIVFGVIGTGLGTYFLQYHFNESFFKLLLGIVLILSAGYLYFKKEVGLKEGNERKMDLKMYVITSVFALVINILNGLLGGTGMFMTLFLIVVLRYSYMNAVALGFASYIAINFVQSGYLLATENYSWLLLIGILAGGILGANLGTHFLFLKGNKMAKTVGMVVILILGVKMLTG